MPPFDMLIDSGTAFRSLELVGMTPKLGQYFGTDKGLLVVRAPASTAYRLEEGDVLLSIDGRVPESPGHAFRILHSYQPGEQVKLNVMRNRKAVELTAKVPPEETGPAPGMLFRAPAPARPSAPAPAPPAPPAPANDDSA
jgi:S1-C subfamily serine protease